MNNNFTLKHKSATLALPLRYLCGKILQPSGGEKTSREDTVSLQYPYSIRIVKALSRTAAVLIMLLTLGVGQMWGGSITSDGTALLFFKMDAVNWWSAGTNGDGNFAYFYGTSGSAWSAHSVQQTGNYYYFVVPAGTWDHVILTRNSVSSSPSWENKWNQTGDISISDGKNYISAFSENSTTATWGTYQLTSTSTLSASSTSITTAQTSTLTPSLTSYTEYNEIKSTTYSVTTNPSSAGSVTAGGVFSATAAGTYIVTATITYNAKGFSGITKTATPTVSITVSAAAETTHSVGITYKCGSTTVSAATNPSIGEVSYSSQTAPTVAGYTFVNWTLGNGVSKHASDALTANPIRVKTLSSGSYTMTANYTEDLTTAWTLKGSFVDDFATTYNFEKRTGESTGNVAYASLSLAAGTTYAFKVVKNGSVWYGNTGTMTSANCTNWTFETSVSNNAGITTTAAGTYTFKIDFSGSDPVVSVIYPTTYTLTYGIGTIVGTNGTITSSPAVASGSLVVSGTSVTLTAPAAKTGYSWKGWYANAAGTGAQIHATQAYTFTVDANTTLYACYNEATYTVALNNGDHGTVSPSGDTQIGASGVEVTATPAAGWMFNGWTKTGTYVNLSSLETNPTTVTASGAGSVTPIYIQRYILRGSLIDDSDNAGMAGWSATDNSAYTSASIAGNVMTVTTTLTKSKTNYKFKIYDLTSEAWRGQTGSGYIPAATQWTLNGGNDVYFASTAIGTYTFAVDFTAANAPAVTVNHPTGYDVTYGFGSTEGADVAPTAATAAGIPVYSTNSVQSGTNVTFTATAAKSGYTWKGWYTTNNTSGTKLSENLTYTTTISAATTVYAVYAEDLYTVTVTAGDNGSITVGSPSVTAGVDTKPTITAVANTGYRFSYWEVVTGTATITDDHAASTTVSASSNATIRAVFGSNWVVGGSTATFGNWNMSNGYSFANFETVGGKELGYVNIVLPANTEYEIKVYDHNYSSWYGHNTTKQTVTYTSNNGTALLFETGDKQNLKIITAGHGTYQFVWNMTDYKLTVNYPTSYTISYGQKTYYGLDESNDATTTGGTFSVVDGDDNALVSGKYIVATDAAVFTAVPASNYSLAGWYKDNTFTDMYINGEDGAVITTNTLALTPTANANVFAKFAENMTTVAIVHNAHGHVELGGETVTSIQTGARTTRSITAVADAGYYFAGWTVTAGTDFTPSATGEANTTITVAGNGAGETTGQTLTANFVELDKVYFRNIFDDGENEPTSWENVYVYYNPYWNESGAGAKNLPYAQMTQIGTSNIYEAYIPRSVTTGGVAAIAFSNVDFHTYNNFYGSKAAYRGDYNSQLNMFVPYHVSNGSPNTTEYFSNGYWMQYDTKIGETAGYYLKKRTGSDTYSQLSQFEAITNHATTIQDTLRIEEMGTSNNKYLITSAGGLKYKAASQITSTNCMGIELVEDNNDDAYFEIDPSTEGYYIIQINQEEDKMKLNVIYPISVGDHRLKHTYTNGGTKYTYSDVIKSHENERTLSMYIDNTTSHSPSLKLQKCTALTAGVPTWSDGTTVAMTGIKTDTMGVFVFDLAITGDAGTISNSAPYRGEYYIKADSLPGGWANFTQNVMILNTNTFDKNKPTTFDRYLCHWYGNRNNEYNTNIKCVVANEYCNQLSDTLYGDAVIGMGNQTLPFPGNVRFSYNSTTNELKRTYLNGSANWEDHFLLLSGSAKLIDKDTRSNFPGNKTTFVDMNNWTYQKDVAAYANSNVILTAEFNGQTQLLLGSTSNTDSVQLVGGVGATAYNMRLVYDFKTDYLIAGYLAGGTQFDENDAIYSDVLIIREQQGDAEQITFGEGKKLTEVRTVYGVMQFNKSYINNEGISRYMRNTYWISFPFDVNLSDVVGFGSYGKHWIIQYYDGAARAANGLWIDSPSYWKRVSSTEREDGFILKANVGYLLSLSLNNMSNSSNVWDNGVTQVALYFPSKDPVETINGELPEAGAFTVPEHPCTIQRDGRYYKDANWNIIGVPSYANVNKMVSSTTAISENDVAFLYDYNTSTNYMEVNEAAAVTFGAMKAYMVQYAGVINWRTQPLPAGLAARRNAAENDNYTLCLNLKQNGETIDKTYVRFNEEGTNGLDMNKDLTKIINSGTHNLYTLCEDIELGAQFLPVTDETVYIPVGIDVPANGTVELAMPDGTDGLEVYLFDRLTQKHTNMLISSYTADLEKGTLKDRFVLEVRRSQMPTDIMTTGKVEEDVTKYMIDGHLYIKKGRNIYNAEGKLVNNEQ